jgi:protein-L-isoaspartate(D-aspartate) O-methyltransferase
MAAMNAVPREEFVPEVERAFATRNQPLSIGHGQTISQPYVVAFMTEALELRPRDRVLEVGTGSGYQAAILAELGCEVYTVETIPELCASARRRLERTGYADVHVRCGNGRVGWPEAAPFVAVLVAAAASSIPDPLLEQLADGGRLIMPVGSPAHGQQLTVVSRTGNRFDSRVLLPVRFVPLTDPGP